MPRAAVLLTLLALLAVGCDDEDKAAAKKPPPVALTQDAMGHFCGMALVEHPGPKGQILLRGDRRPVWFSSARDTVAFTYLDEESKAISAIYVSDMGKAPDWEHPGPDDWVEARRAWFVLGSNRRGGMGAEEAVPFSDQVPPSASPPSMAGGCCAWRSCRVTGCWAMSAGPPRRRPSRLRPRSRVTPPIRTAIEEGHHMRRRALCILAAAAGLGLPRPGASSASAADVPTIVSWTGPVLAASGPFTYTVLSRKPRGGSSSSAWPRSPDWRGCSVSGGPTPGFRS